MEIKAELQKPYTEEQKINFIVDHNHIQGLKIEETETSLVALDYTRDEQAQKRKEEFKRQFFEIVNVGFYRRQPKGYSSALESVNTAFNAVSIMGNLPANTLTFYKEPDYSDPTQCTEEWLVENSFKNKEMTTAEFGQFYASFITAWNTQEHL